MIIIIMIIIIIIIIIMANSSSSSSSGIRVVNVSDIATSTGEILVHFSISAVGSVKTSLILG